MVRLDRVTELIMTHRGGIEMLESRKIIELVKDENKEDRIDYITIACSIPDDQIHELAILNEHLERVGISLKVTRYEGTDILGFKINNESYKKATCRGAGRKKDHNMAARYKECSVAELKVKLGTMKKSEIIKELGCPKATFYRILNNLKVDGCNMENIDSLFDDDSIWIYTS